MKVLYKRKQEKGVPRKKLKNGAIMHFCEQFIMISVKTLASRPVNTLLTVHIMLCKYLTISNNNSGHLP